MWLEVPEELRHVFEPYLMRELCLLPPWVVELRVSWNDDAGEAGLQCTVNAEYRVGTLILCPGWFSGKEAYRRSAIRHELAHFAIDVLHTFAVGLITKVTDDDAFRSHLREQLRRALEMATCDVEEMLGAALGHPDRLPTSGR